MNLQGAGTGSHTRRNDIILVPFGALTLEHEDYGTAFRPLVLGGFFLYHGLYIQVSG